MRVQLSFRVECPADAAWAVLVSPDELTRAYAPLLQVQPEGPLPDRWRSGHEAVIGMRLLGLVPFGRQRIEVRMRRRGETRILEDTGGPLSGPLAIVTSWRHRMAATPLPDGATLYRDRLDVSAGPLTPAVWLALWAVWQLRGMHLRRTMRSR